MSKHRKKCCEPMMYGYGDYGMAGFGGGYPTGTGCGGNYGGWGIRWIYALLVLIVIVLQFGRRHEHAVVASPCGDETIVATGGAGKGLFDNGLIDNSVLFIIVVFLLILCAGCWTGGFANYGSGGGYGFGGYGY